MHAFYEDIFLLTTQKPVWFDENAVPRFCDFEPGRVANIYADEVVLAEIACQNCERKFKVAFSFNKFWSVKSQSKSIQEEIEARSLHYGDPPNVGCCGSGPTMNSEMIQVVEYWWRNEKFEWVRKPELEVVFDEEQ